MADGETILVTGATGFIGAWIVESLYLQGSRDVRAGIRSWSRAARLARFPVDIVVCDVTDEDQLKRAMTGVSCVIHCAKGSADVTVEGTRNALDVAMRLGVSRFVHLSTAEVYGEVEGQIDEKSPLVRTGNPYNEAKVAAEEYCWQYCAKGLPVTVIRPSIVYGPFSTTWTIDLARNLLSGRWRTLGSQADGICNLVYVTDLVSGILLAARHPDAVGEAFNLNGPELLTWNEYFRRFNTALRCEALPATGSGRAKLRSALMNPVRSSVKLMLAHFKEPIKYLSERNRNVRQLLKGFETAIKATPRPDDLRLYGRKANYSCAKAQQMLSYRPSVPVEVGLEMSVAWLRQVGLTDWCQKTWGR